MRTDRELLELAAKASGLKLADEVDSYIPGSHALWIVGPGGRDAVWQPLNDDGDALRLAVKLGLSVEVDLFDGATRVSETEGDLLAKHMHFDGGPEAATRRAIVRAAAEIGAQVAEPTKGEM